MTKEQFCKILQKELDEKDEITPETNFKQLDSFGSLSMTMVLQLVENHFQVQLNPRSFRSVKTVNDLAEIVGNEKLN